MPSHWGPRTRDVPRRRFSHQGRYNHRPHTGNTATEWYKPPSPPRPPPPTRDDSPLREHDLPAQKDAEPTTTVQDMPKPLTTHHISDNYQLPGEGNHTRRITPAWRLLTGTINWKDILPEVVTIEAIHLIITEQMKLSPAEHLFITIQGTATIKGATLSDDDQMSQARPAQAIRVTTTTDANIAIDPDSEWAAIHYTVEDTAGDPKTSNWRQRWTSEVEHLSDAALKDTAQTEKARRYSSPTIWRTRISSTVSPPQMPSSPTAQLSSARTDYTRTPRAQPRRYMAGHSTTTCSAPHGIQSPPGTNPFTENASPDRRDQSHGKHHSE